MNLHRWYLVALAVAIVCVCLPSDAVEGPSREPVDDYAFKSIAEGYTLYRDAEWEATSTVLKTTNDYTLERLHLWTNPHNRFVSYLAIPADSSQWPAPVALLQYDAKGYDGETDVEILTWLVSLSRDGWSVLASVFNSYGKGRSSDQDLWELFPHHRLVLE